MITKNLVWAGEVLDPIRVDNHPNPEYLYKTIMIHATRFSGTIKILGSIELNPSEGDWFIVWEEGFVKPDINDHPEQNRVITMRNTALWMKAVIVPESTTGRVDRITIR